MDFKTWTPQFIAEVRDVKFSFMRLQIAVDMLEHNSLDNYYYDDLVFQVDQMQICYENDKSALQASMRLLVNGGRLLGN